MFGVGSNEVIHSQCVAVMAEPTWTLSDLLLWTLSSLTDFSHQKKMAHLKKMYALFRIFLILEGVISAGVTLNKKSLQENDYLKYIPLDFELSPGA